MKIRLILADFLLSFCVSLVFCFWQLSAGVAAVPESEGTFQTIPLKQEVDGKLWFIQADYQDVSEQLKPGRRQEKARKTSVRISPKLYGTDLAAFQRKVSAMRKLDMLKPGQDVDSARAAREYLEAYVAKITLNGQSRYCWGGHFGAAIFHGLNPGRHSATVEIWTDTGEHFQDMLTILVGEGALSTNAVKKAREVVEKGRQQIERDLSYQEGTQRVQDGRSGSEDM